MEAQPGWRPSVLGELLVVPLGVFSLLWSSKPVAASPLLLSHFFSLALSGLDFLFTVRGCGPGWLLWLPTSAPTPALSCLSSSHLNPTHPLWNRLLPAGPTA